MKTLQNIFVILLILLTIIVSTQVMAEMGEKPLATLTIDGYYVSTQIGDYVHTNIKTIHGEEMSFWGNNELTDFMKKNKGKLMRFTYKICDEYFSEGNCTMRIEILEKAELISAKKQTKVVK
jgi:hypothetical protein